MAPVWFSSEPLAKYCVPPIRPVTSMLLLMNGLFVVTWRTGSYVGTGHRFDMKTWRSGAPEVPDPGSKAKVTGNAA